MRTQLIALAGTAFLFALIALYVREIRYFSNTIGIRHLIAGAEFVALLAGTGSIYRFKDRFTPWSKHLPEVVGIVLFSLFFAPLFASILNRGLGKNTMKTFIFSAESAYISTPFGIIRDQPVEPTGYMLKVVENGKEYRFTYKKQRYFPLTQPGEEIYLPIKKGLFGADVVLLE